MGQKTKQGELTRSKLLKAIKLYYEKHGYAPTVRELGDIVGLKSSATIHSNLKVLKEDGKISWNPNMPRTIRILEVF